MKHLSDDGRLDGLDLVTPGAGRFLGNFQASYFLRELGKSISQRVGELLSSSEFKVATLICCGTGPLRCSAKLFWVKTAKELMGDPASTHSPE